MPTRRDVLRYGSLTILATGLVAGPLSAAEAQRRISMLDSCQKPSPQKVVGNQGKKRHLKKNIATPTPINEYSKSSFVAQTSRGHTITHDVYRRGSGAPVILIQELPGIGTETLHLADQFTCNGFEVIMPHLFGPLGRTNTAGNLIRVMCMRKEFSIFSSNKSSPVVDWLKALCNSVKEETQVNGVGVIGMCLTGNFAISLMGDDAVLAAVAAQPAMPFHNPAALHMSESEIQSTRDRIDSTAPMMAFRFERDILSKESKFKCIQDTFNDDRERVQLCRLPGKGHSVFTLDFVDEDGHATKKALEEVLSYFKHQLQV